MRILILAASHLPIPAYKGGATETLITNLLQQLKESDNLEVIVYSHCKREQNYLTQHKNVKYYYFEETLFEKLYTNLFRIFRIIFLKRINIPSSFAHRIVKNVNLSEFDLILIEGDKNQVNILRKKTKSIIVLHIHTVMTFTKFTPFAKKIFNNCDYILANSEFTQKVITEIKPDSGKKVLKFSNCIIIDDFRIPDKNIARDIIRKKYNINFDDKVFVFCGRLEPGKGVIELIKAFEKCSKNSKLLIIGASWFSSNVQTPYIKKIIEYSKKISNRIIFTGYIDHSELPRYYVAADVCVIPSIYEEAACLVGLEAQAAGLPIVASNIGGIPEFLWKGASSLVDVDNSFIDNLSNEMQLMISKEHNFNQREWDKFLRSYDIKNYYNEFIHILKEIGGDK